MPADASFIRRQMLQLLVWGGYAALIIYIGASYSGYSSGMLLIALGVGGGLWACSEVLRWMAGRHGWLSRPGPALAWRLALAVLLLPVALQGLLYVAITGSLQAGWIEMPGGADYRPHSVFIYWLNSVMPLGLWTAGWVSVQALRRYRQGEVSRLRAEASRSALELDALRARLNPHFVFNALNNLRALINEDTERAREMVTRLSNTLRHALDHGSADSVPLDRELAVIDDYLAIEQVHYEERLQIECEIEPAARAAMLPPMLLQLLVENAIKHGIARTPGGGRLRLWACMRGDVLQLGVDNPGCLSGGGDGHGVGLNYLRSRLSQGLAGARFTLDGGDGRVQALLEIPQ